MIEPHKRTAPYDFVKAVTMAFRIPGDPKFGFRLWLWMTLGLSLVYLVTLPFIVPHYVEIMAINQSNMQDMMSGRTPDNTHLFAALKPLLPGYFVLMFGVWALWVSGETALYRKVLRGEEASKQPLRLGADEGRVLLSQLGVFGIIFCLYIGGAIAVALLISAIAMVSKIMAVLMAFIAIIFLICVLINFCVKLAPAAALSTRNKSVHVLAARKIVKHRFWEIFVAYISVFILGYVAIYIVMYLAIIAVTGNADIFALMTGFGKADPYVVFDAAAERVKNPLVMVVAVLAQIAYAATFALWAMMIVGIGAYTVTWWEADAP